MTTDWQDKQELAHVARKRRGPRPISTLIAITVGLLALLTACGTNGETATTQGDLATTTIQPATTAPTEPEPTTTTTEAEPELRDVTLSLDWFPSTSHAGYYLAQQRGWFEEAGLNVEIFNRQGSTEVVQQVGSGANTFGHANGFGIVSGRVAEAMIKGVANLTQDADFCIIVRADSGIEVPADLEGKIVGAGTGTPLKELLPAIWENGGVDPNSIEQVELSFVAGYPALVEERIDGWIGNGFAGVVVLDLEFDTEASCIPFRDYGAGSLGNTIIASEETIANDPELVQTFVDVAIMAYRYAFEHPDEAGEALEAATEGIEGAVSAASVEGGLPILRASAVGESTEGQPYGWMAAEDWSASIQLMVDYLGLEDPPAPEELFTNEFVSQGEPLD